MAPGRRCAICDRSFRPNVRSRTHQHYCSRRCAKKAKRERDREHKRLYRDTGLGQEQRKRESQKRRERVGWAQYMRYWRRAEPDRRLAQERKRAQRYYERHRDAMVTKRRQQRAARKVAAQARSH